MPPKKQTTTDPPIQTDDDAESVTANLLSPLTSTVESKNIEEFSATKQKSDDNTYTKDASTVEVTNSSVVNDHDTMIIDETIGT